MLGSCMFGVVRRVAGLAAVVLFSLPALAQSSFLSAGPSYSAAQPALPTAIPLQPSFIAAAPTVSLPDHPIALQTPVEGTNSPRALAERTALGVSRKTLTYRSIVVRMAGAFEEVETPFLDQVRVPLISLGSGRVQLTGFQSVTPMVNLVWGLPLRASASGLSVVQQCHPGIRVPRNNQSYGLSLRFRFSKQDADRAGNGLWHAARQAASWGRAFFTL